MEALAIISLVVIFTAYLLFQYNENKQKRRFRALWIGALGIFGTVSAAALFGLPAGVAVAAVSGITALLKD